MRKDYERLMLAAKQLKGLSGPSAVAVFLATKGLSVTNQMVGNWKSRGVAKSKLLESCRIIGCNPNWVETGIGNMAAAVDNVDESVLQRSMNQPTIKPKSRHQDRVDEIVALLQQTDMEGLAVILDRAKDAAREYPLAKKTPKLSP